MFILSKEAFNSKPIRLSKEYASNLIWIVLILFAILYYISAFFPGYFTADSVYILNMATGIEPITNWHPNFIIKLSSISINLLQHVELLWLSQFFLYLYASYFTAKLFPSLGFLVFLMLLFYPPLTTNMAAFWKDNFATIFMLLALASAVKADRTHHHTIYIHSTLFCLAATMSRFDYLALTAPVLFYLSYSMYSNSSRVRTNKWLGVIPILVFVIGFVLSKYFLFFEVERIRNPWVTIAVWDIVGTKIRSGSKTLSVFNQTYLTSDLETRYLCNTSDPLVFSENPLPINLPQEENVLDIQTESMEYKNLWMETIVNNPISYFQHRLCVGSHFLGFSDKIHHPYPFGSVQNNYIGEYVRSAKNLEVYWFYDANAQGWMYRYWVYLTFSVFLLLYFFTIKYQDKILVVVIFSTIFASAARFIILPASDFRYGLWIVVGTIFLTFILVESIIDWLFNSYRRSDG